MKAIAFARRQIRPIAVRIPSERSRSRRGQFRWWPVEIEPHKQLIADLQRSAAATTNKIKNGWLAYLRKISDEQVVAPAAARTAIEIWGILTKDAPTVIPPNARPTEDDGLRLSWNRAGAYIEILVASDGAVDWFYTDTNDTYDGEDNLSIDASLDALVARLRDMF